jgi:hypothetical protein
VIRDHVPNATNFTDHLGSVDEVECSEVCSKSKVRAKAKHAFLMIKRALGFDSVRYCGLAKNTHRLWVNHRPASAFHWADNPSCCAGVARFRAAEQNCYLRGRSAQVWPMLSLADWAWAPHATSATSGWCS